MSTIVYFGWVGGQCNAYEDIFSFFTLKITVQHYSSDITFEANVGLLDGSNSSGRK